MYEPEIRNNWETSEAAEADRVWSSNNSRNEKPYSVIGTIKHEGLKEAPKYEMLRKKYRNVGSCEYVETLFSMT